MAQQASIAGCREHWDSTKWRRLNTCQSFKRNSVLGLGDMPSTANFEMVYWLLKHPVVCLSVGYFLGHQYIMNILSIENQHIG
jgi:hypothetical protein